MNGERGPGALEKKVWLALALVLSFLYYVTFVQFTVLDAGMRDLLVAAFGGLAVPGCLLAGWWIDRMGDATHRLARAIAVCMVAEGLVGCAGRSLPVSAARLAFAPLGLALGAHIVCLFVLLGRCLGARDRATISGIGFGGIYLLANAMVFAAIREGVAVAPFSGPIAGLPLLFLGVALWLRGGSFQPAPVDRAGPLSRGPGGTVLALAPLVILIALDSFSFPTILRDPALRARLLPDPDAWLANGLWHALAAPVAAWLLVRRGRGGALGLSALAFPAFWAAVRFLPGTAPHLPLALYSLFVAGYSVVFYSVWPAAWLPRRAGLVTALGMIICGFGGSVGGIGLSLAMSR